MQILSHILFADHADYKPLSIKFTESAMASVADEMKERRRAQNRLAQRRFRQSKCSTVPAAAA